MTSTQYRRSDNADHAGAGGPNRGRTVFQSAIGLMLMALATGAATDPQSASAQSTSQIELTAWWAPFTDSKYAFGDNWDTLQNLKPASKVWQYNLDELEFLHPPADATVGDVWKMDVGQVIRLLKQLHPGATQRLHHGGPEGAWAILAAESPDYVRIRSRIHAEFRLRDGYYLPSFFAGDVVINRRSGKIVTIRLAVPPRRNNVDLNREQGEGQPVTGPDGEPLKDENGDPIRMAMMIADIGYCERLELSGGEDELAAAIDWTRTLAADQIERELQRKFYKFAQIDWLPWEKAVRQSAATGRPLHVVALFGSLDDESC